jgi:hypothetical protein
MSDKKFFNIYNYTLSVEPKQFSTAPYDLDYNILGLYKKRYFDKGELQLIEYYGEYDPITKQYDQKCVCEHRTYYRINEMVYRREMEINWILADGTTGATKQGTKYYTPEESIVAGERRRSQVISSLKTAVVGLIMAVSGLTQQEAEEGGKPFLSYYAGEINAYISGYEDDLKNAIMTTTNPDFDWLDAPIDQNGTLVRHYVYNEINIDYTINNIYM